MSEDDARIVREHALLLEAIRENPSPAAIWDERDRLIAWNPSFAHLHAEAFRRYPEAVERRELRFDDVMRLTAPADATPEEVEAHLAGWRRSQREATGEPFDRHYPGFGWFRITKTRTPGGAVAGFGMDITELKEKSEALERARAAAEEANAAKSRFVANVSHELRTPLNGMLGMAALLADTSLDQRQGETVAIMRAAGEHLLALLNDLLDLDRVERDALELRPDVFEIPRLVADVERLFAAGAQAKRLTLAVRIDGAGAERAVGDALRIRQILANLVSNAIKFTHRGGVTIGVGSLARDGEVELRVDVADTGPGLEVDELARLFADYSQLDNARAFGSNGSGLGLSISRRLAEMMGGALTARSAPGAGSVFTLALRLPAAPVEDDARTVAETAGGGGAQPIRLLLADDNAVNRKVIEGYLAPLGVEIAAAGDGRAAVTAWERDDFDLILMDSRMPRMSGVEAAEIIRAREREAGRERTPIVSISASGEAEHAARFRAAGMDVCLTKPLRRDELAETVRRLARRD